MLTTSESGLYQPLKAMAIQREEHRWYNSRGEHFQAALILKPELRPILADLLRGMGCELATCERTVLRVESDTQQLPLSIHGHEEFANVTLRTKRSYRSYMVNLDEPNPEMIKLRRKRLELSHLEFVCESEVHPGVAAPRVQSFQELTLSDPKFYRVTKSDMHIMPQESLPTTDMSIAFAEECTV